MCMTHVDMPSCYTERLRTARKVHKCSECANEIRSGEKYRYDSGIWDGHPHTYKTCMSCVRIREWLGGEMKAERLYPNEHVDECGAWVFGELAEACYEAYAEWRIEKRRCDVHFWIPNSRGAAEHEECESEYV